MEGCVPLRAIIRNYSRRLYQKMGMEEDIKFMPTLESAMENDRPGATVINMTTRAWHWDTTQEEVLSLNTV